MTSEVYLPCRPQSIGAEHSKGHVSLPEVEKDLPRPPTKFHTARHSANSFYYRQWKPLWQQGYRCGVLYCAATTGVVFLINLIATIVATQKAGISQGLGTLQSGDCNKIKRLSQWLHLMINLLGTLLLGASNYCMQGLSSPTRKEINDAHRRGTWLDVGVPSLTNLRRVSWKRIFLWGLLALSSIPLHLMYNSAVFGTLSYQKFTVFVVGENFLTGADYSVTDFTNSGLGYVSDSRNISTVLQLVRKTSDSLQRLENKECIEAYSPFIVSNRGNVLVISSFQNSTNSLLSIESGRTLGFLENLQPNLWMCNDVLNCDVTKVEANAKNWTYGRGNQYPVSYCLSTKMEDQCKLQFSITIMVAVISCNFVKLVCMIIVAWKLRFHPLVTLGDAIASFLNEPDSTTDGICLAGKPPFRKRQNWRDLPVQYNPKPHRWLNAASRSRWCVHITLCLLTLLAASGLLIIANSSLQDRGGPRSPWNLGFGAVRPETSLGLQSHINGSNLISMTLLANSPQILLSFLYLTYNGLYTCMLLAEEWSGFAHKRKALRVTSPTGEQRSTYRLQLPYRYGISLLIMSGILHWLVSQSIFLVRINEYDCTEVVKPLDTITTCGYSPIAILASITVGAITFLQSIAISLRLYKIEMPLVGSNSVAISAACHPPGADQGASVKRLMWGVIKKEAAAEPGDEVGHCSFTSLKVEKPVAGKMYAGYRR